MTGNTIQDLHTELDLLIESANKGEKDKALQLLKLYNEQLSREVNQCFERKE
ncbi:hypothetical protein AB4122_12735 [Vibrio cyclitrophicus]